jgi:hypothetical protein
MRMKGLPGCTARILDPVASFHNSLPNYESWLWPTISMKLEKTLISETQDYVPKKRLRYINELAKGQSLALYQVDHF